MFEYDFKVQYVDIDSSGFLSEYGLLKNLQEIACLHADSRGFGLNDTQNNRLAWVILSWKIDFISRPLWNTSIHIKTWASNIDNVSCERDFEVTDENGNKVAIATSKWVLINIDTHHISKITSEIRQAFEPTASSVFEGELNKLESPESFDYCFKYTILRRDIDTNQHLNNLNYIMLAKETLPELIDFNHIEVLYKHQCLLGDKMVFLCKKYDNCYIISIKCEDDDVVHAIVKLENK